MTQTTLDAGLTYMPEVLTTDEELDLLAWADRIDFRSITMRGVTARRTVACFAKPGVIDLFPCVPLMGSGFIRGTRIYG